jgi:hypothetical protein
MSVHYTYNKEKDMLYAAAEDNVSIEELTTVLNEISSSDIFSPDVKTLWDIRKLDFSKIDSDFARQLINVRKQNTSRGNAKVAILAEQDLAYGMSRMYESMSDGMPQTIMVFKELKKAEDWLLGK